MPKIIVTSLLAVACLTGSLGAAPPQQTPAVSMPGYPAVGSPSAVNFMTGMSIAGTDMPSMTMLIPMVIDIAIDSLDPAAGL